MLGIRINGEMLDLPEGSAMELESENPFLQFNEEILGEYSLPSKAIVNAKNNRLLNYGGIPHKKVTNEGIDADLFDGGIQLGTGKVKIEKAATHLNQVGKGNIDIYWLSKSAGFFQDARDKRLRDIDTPDITIAGNVSFGPVLNSSPFATHVKTVMQAAIGAYDYAFFPVYNANWGDDPGRRFKPDVMNEVEWDAGTLKLKTRTPVVPFPYLKLVLQKAVAASGWTITGNILEDADFLKIVLLNTKSIRYGYYKKVSFDPFLYMHDEVSWNIRDHLPDISVGEFLVALKNRFAWWYDFNNTTKTITIKQLKDLATGTPVDYTSYSSPLLTKSISQDSNIYALRNLFTIGGGGDLDISVLDYHGEIDKTSDLPAAAEAYADQVYLVIEENNYYMCRQNEEEEDDAWYWMIIGGNIYDYLPEGATEEITTAATTVELMRRDDYLDLIPRLDNPGTFNGIDGETAWGIHLCFFFGMRNNKSGDPYPFASHHIYDSQGYTMAAWSLAFKAKKTDDTEVGLYDLAWKPFLDMLQNQEEVEHTLYLPLHKYLQLSFSDRIIVNGIELFVKQKKSAIPYTGIITCTSIRI